MRTLILLVATMLSMSVSAGVLGDPIRIESCPTDAMAVCAEDNRLYVAAGDALVVYDIIEPLSPKFLGDLKGMDNRRQIVSQKGFVYVVSRESGLRIVDARNPANMKIRSRFDSVEFATGIDIVGNTVFLSERIYGVEVVDVSDPDHPEHVCIRKTHESQSNRYRDGYLYSGEWKSGAVTIFDAHDLSNFRPIASVNLGGFGDGLELDGNFLYCSTGHDATNRQIEDPQGRGRGLDIFELTDPARPRHVSRIDFPKFTPRNEDFWTPRVSNGYAFCCDSHNGLFVVDVHNPTMPKIVDRFCVPQSGKDWPSGAISSCAIGNGCIYVTSFPGGLWVIPVSGVASPKRPKGVLPKNVTYRETYPTDVDKFHVYRPSVAGQARTVCVKGDVAYAAFGDAGLHVLRLRSEGGFEKLGELPGRHRVLDCCFMGDKLVTAEGLDGFAVYDLLGSATFAERARRPLICADGRSVAFWCWPVDARHILLSTRHNPSCLIDINEFENAQPIVRVPGTCQWDKYPSSYNLDGQFPILVPYRGLSWIDLTASSPRLFACTNGIDRLNTGNQCNGICVFDNTRFLYTVGGKYCYVKPDRTRSSLQSLPLVPGLTSGKDVYFGGIPRKDENLVVLTSRSTRQIAVFDFADPDAPKLLRSYKLSGNPDIATFYHGKVLIPAGHQGLLMEK